MGVAVPPGSGDSQVTLEFGLGPFVLLKFVKVFQEQKPGGLFCVIEFGGATGFLQRTSSMF